MKFIAISIGASILIAVLISIIETSRKRRRIAVYAQAKEPFIVRSLHENDKEVLNRCSKHLYGLLMSGNKIHQYIESQSDNNRKLKYQIVGETKPKEYWLDFVFPLIFRDGFPLETWEEYLLRADATEAIYLEAYHRWIREKLGEKLDVNEWYVENILTQQGAAQVRHFITFQK